MIWAVNVVPMLAPRMTPIDCVNVSIPPLTSPTEMTVVMETLPVGPLAPVASCPRGVAAGAPAW